MVCPADGRKKSIALQRSHGNVDSRTRTLSLAFLRLWTPDNSGSYLHFCYALLSLINCTNYSSTQVDWLPFMDELAKKVGVYPNLTKYFFTNPKLWFACWFGPGAAYQYRLEGPNKWEGAREAMLSIQKRINAPLETNKGREASTNKLTNWNCVHLIIITIIISSVLTALLTAIFIWKVVVHKLCKSDNFTN